MKSRKKIYVPDLVINILFTIIFLISDWLLLRGKELIVVPFLGALISMEALFHFKYKTWNKKTYTILSILYYLVFTMLIVFNVLFWTSQFIYGGFGQ
jgi:hypothetical protein